jgi:hypothetical protein
MLLPFQKIYISLESLPEQRKISPLWSRRMETGNCEKITKNWLSLCFRLISKKGSEKQKSISVIDVGRGDESGVEWSGAELQGGSNSQMLEEFPV